MGENLVVNYKQKTEKIQSELQKVQKLFSGIFDNHNKEIGKYLEFVNNPDIQVAIIGSVKAGKSTLINAILGVDIASTEVTPETAALTIFKYSSNENYVEVHFYNTDEWNELWASAKGKENSPFRKEYDSTGAESERNKWLNRPPIIEKISDELLKSKVKDYSSSKSPIHYFVKKLVIGLSKWGNENFPLPKELCFVDTPGLNDVIPYRSDITRDYIDRANAAVICVNSSTMRSEEFSTIVKTFENIGNNKEKVIILGTQVDRLNKPVEDWNKQKELWHKQIADLYDNNTDLISTNIIGVSAYIFRLAQKLDTEELIEDTEIGAITTFAEKNGIKIRASNSNVLEKISSIFTDEKNVILKNKEWILNCTNIGKFLKVLEEGPLSEPEKILADDLAFKYEHRVNELKKATNDQKEKIEKQLELLHSDMQKKQEAIEQKTKEINKIKASSKTIQQQFDTMHKDITAEITNMTDRLNSELKTL